MYLRIYRLTVLMLPLILAGCTTYMTEDEVAALGKQEAAKEALEERAAVVETDDEFIYRVQVAAEESEETAHIKAAEAAGSGFEPVHIIYSGEFWRVQVGDFESRSSAEEAKKNLLGEGWVGSWIVKLEPPPSFGRMNLPDEPDFDSAAPENLFRIQVAAYADHESAQKLAKVLHDGIDDPVYIVEQDSLFKVQVGDFKSAEEAERLIAVLSDSGYQELWIVKPENAEGTDAIKE